VGFEGNEFLIFEVEALKDANLHGKTRTAYIRKKVESKKNIGFKKRKKRNDP
jgi:hypothetical protein